MPAAWRGKYYPPAMEIYRIIYTSTAVRAPGPANLARLVAALAPPHRQSPPLARDGQRNTAAVLLNFIEVHCSHLLALPGPDPASRLPRPQPT